MIYMGLERVIEEILASGEGQRAKILADAAAERRKVISAATSEGEAAKKARQKEAEQRAMMTKQQALSSAELEAKKHLLQEQNAILIQTKGQVLEALASLDTNARKSILEKLGQIAAKNLSKGVAHCRKDDERIFTPPSGFKKVADLKSAGGILAESEDGAYRMDLTFEVLLDDVWNRDVQKIYEILFGGA